MLLNSTCVISTDINIFPEKIIKKGTIKVEKLLVSNPLLKIDIIKLRYSPL